MRTNKKIQTDGGSKVKLIIAEKPSVAISIANVLGANKRQDGYIEGKDSIVSWCVGHLIRMSNPESYDAKYKKWSIEELPIIPKNYKYEIVKYTSKQYKIIKKLMDDKRIKEIVNACDSGREGELIFGLVYDLAKCKKPVKRFWVSSMEDKALKEGFNNLRDGKEYEKLYESALARSQADWLVGMNLSRYYSCLHNKSYSVGRVQTPTLSLIVERDKSIKEFKKEKYYTVEINAAGISFESLRIDDKEEIKKLLLSIPEELIITEIENERKVKRPDNLFDLTKLQRECNKYFGYSAKQTLDYAQSLYEKKLITYPRTDSNYLTSDMAKGVKEYVDSFGDDFSESNFNRIFNSDKVSDHHGIIPTKDSISFDTSKLQRSEERVLELIKAKLLAARSGDYITETTKIVCQIGDYKFIATGGVVIDPGYTKYFTNYVKKKEDKFLPKLNVNDKVLVENKKIKEKYTSPPKNYTEETLLKSMELAGSKENSDIEVERKGLGTPATRAGILENLIAKELIQRDGKKLITTQKGQELIAIVADFLKKPDTTAQWEASLYKISKGKVRSQDFISDIENTIKKIILE